MKTIQTPRLFVCKIVEQVLKNPYDAFGYYFVFTYQKQTSVAAPSSSL